MILFRPQCVIENICSIFMRWQKSGVIITWFNITWYYIQHIYGALDIETYKDTPYLDLTGELWGVFDEWVIDFNGLSWTVVIEVHLIYIIQVIKTYILESLPSCPWWGFWGNLTML